MNNNFDDFNFDEDDNHNNLQKPLPSTEKSNIDFGEENLEQSLENRNPFVRDQAQHAPINPPPTNTNIRSTNEQAHEAASRIIGCLITLILLSALIFGAIYLIQFIMSKVKTHHNISPKVISPERLQPPSQAFHIPSIFAVQKNNDQRGLQDTIPPLHYNIPLLAPLTKASLPQLPSVDPVSDHASKSPLQSQNQSIQDQSITELTHIDDQLAILSDNTRSGVFENIAQYQDKLNIIKKQLKEYLPENAQLAEQNAQICSINNKNLYLSQWIDNLSSNISMLKSEAKTQAANNNASNNKLIYENKSSLSSKALKPKTQIHKKKISSPIIKQNKISSTYKTSPKTVDQISPRKGSIAPQSYIPTERNAPSTKYNTSYAPSKVSPSPSPITQGSQQSPMTQKFLVCPQNHFLYAGACYANDYFYLDCPEGYSMGSDQLCYPD